MENPRRGYLMGRYPGFLGLGLRGRVAVALLELSLEFGVQNTRGILIRIALTQRQLADLVGASRAKVGLVLLDLERQQIVIREGHHTCRRRTPARGTGEIAESNRRLTRR